jgi:hypothetical protein
MKTRAKQIKGKRREELIERWLRGEEDPEWDVKPTKTEGKFIIKQRPHQQPPQEAPEPQEEEDQPAPPPESAPPPEPKTEPLYTEPVQKKKRKDKKLISDDIGLRILRHLRELGEERKEKERRRMQREIIKTQVQKQFQRQTPQYEPIQQDDEPQYELPAVPVLRRRTVNLLQTRGY